jgi:putative FmdB family regulatory protein
MTSTGSVLTFGEGEPLLVAVFWNRLSMPTYEYVCEKCDHEFELFQSITVDALETCPREACPKKRWAKGRVRRAIGTGAGILFKGSGFYETDYRSESYKAGAKKESESKKKSDSSSKSDTKTKSDSKPKTANSSGKSSSKK